MRPPVLSSERVRAPAAQSQEDITAPDHIALGIAYAALAHRAVGSIWALLYAASTLFQEFKLARQLGGMVIATGGFWLLTLGLSQCVYLIPMAIYLRYTERPRAVIGVLSSMGVVFFLCIVWLGILVFGLSPRFVG